MRTRRLKDIRRVPVEGLSGLRAQRVGGAVLVLAGSGTIDSDADQLEIGPEDVVTTAPDESHALRPGRVTACASSASTPGE